MNKKEVSFADLLMIVRKRWWLILIFGMIVAGSVGIFSIRTYSPVYKSDSLFYVKAQGSDDNASISAEISSVNWALKVINSFTTMVHTNSFSDEIKNEYAVKFPGDDSISNYSSMRIRNMITVSSVEDTNLFKVSVRAPQAEMSYNIGQCVEVVVGRFIEAKTGMSNAVTVADQCKMPYAPANSNHLARNTAIGFVFGVILMYMLLFFIDLFDVRVKNEEDLMNNYTLPIIGTVPTFEAPSNRKKVYKYGDQ